jgi:hypothetical protein
MLIRQTDGLSELKALASIIAEAIGRIELTLEAEGLTYPSLNTLSDTDSEAARSIPSVLEASALIVAAASQLAATARPPKHSIALHAWQVCAFF